MNSRIIRLPRVNANDSTAELVEWFFSDFDEVAQGDTLGIFETTKATLDIKADSSGFFKSMVTDGDHVSIGAIVAVILENHDSNVDELLSLNSSPKPKKLWTKKAELVAKRLGIDIVAVSERLNRTVTEADVLAEGPSIDSINDVVDDRYQSGALERVLLIGGGGGGGAITVDAISRTSHQRAVGILDQNKELHGKSLMGVPIFGDLSKVEELWKDNYFDAVIVVITSSISERENVFGYVKKLGISTTNVIDPSVDIRSNVNIGTGNLIIANGFLGACSSIGDNNFIASHGCIEHHCNIGSHCTFGPRTTLSGAVTIGDGVKTGMGVLIEPYLKIGAGSLVPSGVAVTCDIPEKSVLKIKNQYVIKDIK